MLKNTPPHPIESVLLAPLTEEVVKRLQAIRLMAFDVDGVLTDGRLWYGDQGEVFKSFHALDGHGLRLLKECGITVALITGRESAIVTRRASELGIAEVHQNVRDKLSCLKEIAKERNLTLDQVGYMGDDLIDITAMRQVGFAASVPNAPHYITQLAHWVAHLAGGSGAARECCDLILAAQGYLGNYFAADNPTGLTGVIQ
ncbi:MAG TPA: HAD-IIIA family hydrolase [Paenalcaligenes sp.]|nr:HAD-IIIA family hydrolase [Paenalcaligenes sp.]